MTRGRLDGKHGSLHSSSPWKGGEGRKAKPRTHSDRPYQGQGSGAPCTATPIHDVASHVWIAEAG
jgi:hypothetical protein